jgi:hypothetical protein
MSTRSSRPTTADHTAQRYSVDQALLATVTRTSLTGATGAWDVFESSSKMEQVGV